MGYRRNYVMEKTECPLCGEKVTPSGMPFCLHVHEEEKPVCEHCIKAAERNELEKRMKGYAAKLEGRRNTLLEYVSGASLLNLPSYEDYLKKNEQPEEPEEVT
ncbi:unnamed protein product [marine sediment metagenome]|uniref:Uncharacterized protein n=1 Tax=marine sediment metagenome TaxID=412755 RepID=X1RMD6_9ZZZZ